MKELIDQGAHFTVGLIVALIVILLAPASSVVVGGIVGAALGFVREITEGGNVFSDGSCLDLTFWTLGGLTAGALFVL
jgi:hypothetical protein